MSEDFGRFHPVWNVPQDARKSFELAKNFFQETGFGEIRMDLFDSGSGTLTVSFVREGNGEPAVFAEYLAVQAYLAQRDGLGKKEVRERLEQAADALRTNESLRKTVMEKSLSTTANELEQIITTTKIESDVLGNTDDKEIRLTLEENLRDYIAGKRGQEKEI